MLPWICCHCWWAQEIMYADGRTFQKASHHWHMKLGHFGFKMHLKDCETMKKYYPVCWQNQHWNMRQKFLLFNRTMIQPTEDRSCRGTVEELLSTPLLSSPSILIGHLAIVETASKDRCKHVGYISQLTSILRKRVIFKNWIQFQ